MPIDPVAEVTYAVLGVQSAWSQSGLSIHGFLERVLDAMPDLSEGGEADQRQRLLSVRLRGLLETGDGIVVTSKALELMTEYDRIFCQNGARVVSDIRPVFSTDLHPKAAVIVHQLRIAYHEGGQTEPRQFFVALDSSDLRQLKSVLERAEEKEQQLRATVEAAQMVCPDADG
jgi:hypothetical protein